MYRGGHDRRRSLESARAAPLPRRGSAGQPRCRPKHQEDAMDKKAKVPKKTKATPAGKTKADTTTKK
jgi:hypothetical protein